MRAIQSSSRVLFELVDQTQKPVFNLIMGKSNSWKRGGNLFICFKPMARVIVSASDPSA